MCMRDVFVSGGGYHGSCVGYVCLYLSCVLTLHSRDTFSEVPPRSASPDIPRHDEEDDDCILLILLPHSLVILKYYFFDIHRRGREFVLWQ